MKSIGEALVKNQNTYGVQGLLMAGIATNKVTGGKVVQSEKKQLTLVWNCHQLQRREKCQASIVLGRHDQGLCKRLDFRRLSLSGGLSVSWRIFRK